MVQLQPYTFSTIMNGSEYRIYDQYSYIIILSLYSRELLKHIR